MADSYWVDPTISQIRSVSILGVDVTSYINAIRIFETVCKPYITGQLTLVDTNNLIENMKIQGGESVQGAFQAPPNESVYEFDTRVLTIKGHPAPNSLKKVIYTIDIIGPLYYADRGALVQSAHKGQTGTSAIQQIFGQYLGTDTLTILQESIGMIGDKQGFTVNNKKPLTAISDISKQSLFPGQSGNVLMFRDRYGVILSPLDNLMSNLGEGQEFFLQKEVWGFDMDPQWIYHAIIFAASDNSRSGGRGGMAEVAAVANQSQVTFDMHNAELKIKDAASIVGGAISSGLNAVTGFLGISPGGLGGTPNVQVHNTQLQPAATAANIKTMAEKMYSAQARGGPQLQWKVPLQTGINVTVGRGAKVTLAPPTDLAIDPNSVGTNGVYFVTDLAHELVVTDLGDVVGTTTMQGLLGGYGK
jgi:hypothetical protein